VQDSGKIIGVMGSGLIGTDPFAVDAWSGSSRFFFGECDRQGILARAFGVEVGPALRLPLMLRNFSTDRDLWRQRFYLDTAYYNGLSRAIVQRLGTQDEGCGLLQIGGIYNLRRRLGAARPIYSYHDGNLATAMQSPQFSRRLPERTVQRALRYEREVYQGIDVIFTMSEYLRRSFIDDFGVKAQQVVTIGAGINLEDAPRLPADKPYDSQKLLFLGADFERKGGRTLLEAFWIVRRAHPAAELYIVGPRELSISAEHSAGVHNVGFLSKGVESDRQRLEKILREASLFVLPSIYEPFGIAPLEAMAAGIPAVLSDAWAFPEMVTPGVNGALVRSGDARDLADQLIELLRDPERLRVMGAAGRKRVLENFTWPTVVNKMRAHLRAPG
jgi:glycosyltransferase involved in cell wall biosynthesis